MATMTIRMSDEDAEIVRKYAQFNGTTVSDFARDAIFERIEDAQDVAELRRVLAEDDGTRYSHEDVRTALGF